MPWWDREKRIGPYEAEEQAAEEIGGRRSIASGALFGDYDATSNEFVIDQKVTDAKSFSVNIEKFLKMFRASGGRKPAYRVTFRQHGETLYIMRAVDVRHMMDALKAASEREDE